MIFNVVYRSTNACDQIQIGGIDEPPTELERGGRGVRNSHVSHHLLESKKPRFYGAFFCLDSPELSIAV